MRNFFLASLITVMSFFLGAAPVQLHCWIVRSANGEADNSVASISNEVAHELGHACGLDDIYESHSGTSLTVSGPPDKLRFTHDWGWYPENLTQVDIVKRLLMYGYSSNTKGDISRGDVYGLWYEQVWNPSRNAYDKVWQLGLAPVGFKLHGNRHPVSE